MEETVSVEHDRGPEGRLSFDVDAALLFELGEQLVARKSIALAELIKNAYDADATEVIVSFEDVTTDGGTITVTDNGAGMTFEAIRDYWMTIATTNKVERPHTARLGRATTGAKGVGRFAVRKLAKRLTLTTTAQSGAGQWEQTVVEFDWDTYKAGHRLSDVENAYKHEFLRESVPTGTTLRMVGTREVWSADDVREVRRDLQDLTPPFTAFTASLDATKDTSAFSVRFETPEFPDLQGYISEQFLSAAVGRLTGHIAEDGTARYTLDLRARPGTTELALAEPRFTPLAGAAFVLHYFIYDSSFFSELGMTQGEARELGREFAGIRIYLDGFRVFPYGDRGDDWLKLDETRGRRLTKVDDVLRAYMPEDPAIRPMLNRPGNNNVFGAVYISRVRHPEIRPTLSRERFVENNAFQSLSAFVQLGIQWMIIERASFESVRARAQKPVSLSSGRQTVSALVADVAVQIEERLRRLGANRDTRAISGLVSDLEARVKTRERADLDKVAVMRILASAGTMVMIFTHQMRGLLNGLKRVVQDLGPVGSAPPADLSENLDEVRSRMANWTQMMDAQGLQLGLLLGEQSRRRARRLVVLPIARQLYSTFEAYADDMGIDITVDVEPDLRTPAMFEAELHSILLNLLTNSLKAVRQEPLRRIRLSAGMEGSSMFLEVADTGRGLPPGARERLFDPFVTTSAPDPELGVGTGLGLTIVRDIVADYDGDVAFVDAPEPWRTCVRITLPRELPA